jgi:non-ribosomal peptide synthetase component F
VARHPRPARRPAFESFPRPALDRSIAARFGQQVDRAPDRPAVTSDSVTWSYGDLDAAANRVARALLRRSATGCPWCC